METTVHLKKLMLVICALAVSPFGIGVKKEKFQVYAITLYKINKALETQNLQENPLEKVIPNEYQEFLPLIIKVIVETLSLHRPYDHKIKLQE
jgi:hypothetical protein